jgi:hypothetical protein
MQHAGLRVGGCVYLHLHALKLIHPALDLFNPHHIVFYLVHPVTDSGGTPQRQRFRFRGLA